MAAAVGRGVGDRARLATSCPRESVQLARAARRARFAAATARALARQAIAAYRASMTPVPAPTGAVLCAERAPDCSARAHT